MGDSTTLRKTPACRTEAGCLARKGFAGYLGPYLAQHAAIIGMCRNEKLLDLPPRAHLSALALDTGPSSPRETLCSLHSQLLYKYI